MLHAEPIARAGLKKGFWLKDAADISEVEEEELAHASGMIAFLGGWSLIADLLKMRRIS
jgi:hypothetical protein